MGSAGGGWHGELMTVPERNEIRTCYPAQIVGEEASPGLGERPEAQDIPPSAGVENVAPFPAGRRLATIFSSIGARDIVACVAASQRLDELPVRVHGPAAASRCYVGLCRRPGGILPSRGEQRRWNRVVAGRGVNLCARLSGSEASVGVEESSVFVGEPRCLAES